VDVKKTQKKKKKAEKKKIQTLPLLSGSPGVGAPEQETKRNEKK